MAGKPTDGHIDTRPRKDYSMSSPSHDPAQYQPPYTPQPYYPQDLQRHAPVMPPHLAQQGYQQRLDESRASGLSTASVVVGGVSLIGLVPFIGLLFWWMAIPGLVMAIAAQSRDASSASRHRGRIGIWVNIAGIVLPGLGWMVLLAIGAAGGSS